MNAINKLNAISNIIDNTELCAEAMVSEIETILNTQLNTEEIEKRYIVVNHSYEGLAGEMTDWTCQVETLDEAMNYFELQKDISKDYEDSFVLVIDKKDGSIIKKYYAYETAED